MPTVKTSKNRCAVETSKIFPKLFHKELTSEMDVIEMSKEGVTK